VKRVFTIGGAVAVAAALVGAVLVALPMVGGASSQDGSAIVAERLNMTEGTYPVTIPANSAPKAGECRNGYVALTFDDGPTKLTPKLLTTLRKIGVKATFFDVGRQALLYPAWVKQESYQGWVGNHSYSHPDLVAIGEPGAFNELLGTNQVIQKITGQTPTLFRSPFDDINYQVDFDARDLGMTSVIWTTDSHDYTGVNAATIVANAETVAPGGIILFHDGYQATIDALPKIVDNLASRGLCAGQIVPSPDPIITSSDQSFYATVVHW
jgi:peptidoglycan/xylan/chitin deacetylase (PgdA/CDA1 family)